MYSTQTLPGAPFGAPSAADIHSPVIPTDTLQVPKSRGTAYNKICNCVHEVAVSTVKVAMDKCQLCMKSTGSLIS